MHLLADKRIFKTSFFAKVGHIKKQGTSFSLTLDRAQRCYLAASIILLTSFCLSLVSDSQFIDWLGTIGFLVAVIGLTSEFWPRFIHFWDSLLGKGVILMFYAFIANFALANASGTINELTGVSADHLPYTHNLSVLLSLPTWFILTSLFALTIVNLLMPLYLMLLLTLKPFGGHRVWFSPNYRFPITTALIRYSFTVIFSVSFIAYSTNLGLADTALQGQLARIVEKIESYDNKPELAAEQLIPNVSISEKPGFENEENHTQKTENVSGQMRLNVEHYQKYIRFLLSEFIYSYEADSKSRCQHTAGSRVIELNDYEILEIAKDKDFSLGYRYQVKKCHSPAFHVQG